jgi:uncharacterized protein
VIARRRSSVGVSVAAMLQLVCACRSVPTRLFTLEPVMPDLTARSYLGPPIRIEAVHTPPALDRIEIMTEIAPGEFKVSDADHWAAPLGELTRQALSADLIARLPTGKVVFPHLAKPAGTIGITVDVIAFGSSRESAHLQASWMASSGGSSASVCGGTVALHVTLAGTGSVGQVNAFSVLVAQLADDIAVDLTQAPPSCS